MSVTLDKKTKTYTVRWRETDALSGQVVRRARRGFKTKKEARRFEDDISDLRSFSSFGQVFNLYLDSSAGYANLETLKRKRFLVEKYAAALLPMNVQKISHADLVKLKNSIIALDRSLETKNKIIEVVKSVSRFGHDFYGYKDFAASLRRLPKSSDDVREISVISPGDFELLLSCCDSEVYKRFFSFLYHTGLRRGEALALTKADICGLSVSVNKSIRRNKTGVTPLKTAASKRTITINKYAAAAIAPLLDLPGDYVFGQYEPLPATSVSRHFDKALKKAGLPHYRVHDLRHSFVSNLILNGVDVVSVSAYVGHADVERTLNTYSHVLKDSEARLVAASESIWTHNGRAK